MGQNLDDANAYYKQQWASEMSPFFGARGTNFFQLINPQSAEEKTNSLVLRERYKIDPVFAQTVDATYGPLDWRLPEAHAIYWGAQGLDVAKKNPDKVKADDLITLRRIIYQSMLQAFHHGRIIDDPFAKTSSLEPNLELVQKVNDAYLTLMQEDAQNRDHIGTAYRNFLKDAVYFLYENNRVAEAAKWYKILGEKFPDKTILDNDFNSYASNLTLDEYAVARVQEEVGDTSQERITGTIEGLIARSFYELVIGQDDRAAGFKLLARKVYGSYTKKMSKMQANIERAGLPSFDVLNRSVLNKLLDTQQPALPFDARAVLRTQLGLPAETNAPPAAVSTNTLPIETNSVENIPNNPAAK
jgi:hypothetical protein